MVADAQPQVTQPLVITEVVISGPAGTIKIKFERLNQRIQSWIKNWTVVEIDDPMTSPLVVPETDGSFWFAFQRNQGSIAVAE